MGTNTKILRNRIKSVDSTLHLTKAMGLVASSKIRGATANHNKSAAYVTALKKIIESISDNIECKNSTYIAGNNSDNDLVIVIAGDRGLAGGYNANVFREAAQYCNSEIIAIGKRACEKYSQNMVSSEKFSGTDAYNLSKEICLRYKSDEISTVKIVRTKYVSLMSQEAYTQQVLPFQSENNFQSSGMIFEPDVKSILESAIVEYLAGEILCSVRESYLSEVVARRMAMDSAGKNAQTMIDDLMLEYNRARQSAITQEITEIIAGSGN